MVMLPKSRRHVPWLVAVALFSLVLAGCGAAASPEHTKAVAKFQNLGGRVNIRDGGFEIDLKGTLVEDDDLAELKNIDNLKAVDLRRTRITKAAFDYLRPIQTLEVVLLSENSEITEEDIDAFDAELQNVEVIR